VADGFTGNVVLKTLEGGVKAVRRAYDDAFASTPAYAAAAAILQPALAPLHETLDPDTYGGAALLGVDGVCIISHGSSNARAMVNAIRVGREMVEADLVGSLRAAIAAG
jgi:phosphate acyltransferase